MSILTFKGGIHPYEGKNMSKSKTIRELLPVGNLVFPVSGHIGAPAIPIVNVGDYVLCNQLIAKQNGNVSANIHSSVSGTVVAIEKRLVANGSFVDSIIIENDNEYKEQLITDYRKLDELSNSDIIDLIKDSGIIGLGGAGFPTHVKLSPNNPDDIEYIIVNGAECEPYLTSDYRRMTEDPDRLVEGLKIILKLFPNAKGIIAIEDNKLDAVVRLKQIVKKEPKIEVKSVYTKYPQGAERVLIYSLTKRELNSSMLPAQVGCIVHNIDTVFAIYNSVVMKKPLTQRIITVTGNAIKRPANFLVKIGTNLEEVIKAGKGFKTEPEKIIVGGPMMGISIYDTNIPITKSVSAVVAFIKDEVSAVSESNCINCGRCVDVCPGRIMPTRVAEFARRKDEEMFLKYDGLECCECGCCSYICPAKRDLTQSIKVMRRSILSKNKK